MSNRRTSVQCPRINAALVPAELKTLQQWVVWKYSNRGEKATKIPYDTRRGKTAIARERPGRSFIPPNVVGLPRGRPLLVRCRRELVPTRRRRL